jgi:hypothetical protein
MGVISCSRYSTGTVIQMKYITKELALWHIFMYHIGTMVYDPG